MTNKTHTNSSKDIDARYSSRNIDAKDRQDGKVGTHVCSETVIGSRSRPMPSATVKSNSKLKLKGKVPKGLDVKVETANGEMVLLDIWLTYKDEPTLEFRNVLMEHYLKLVRYTAERVHQKLPSEVDVDDLYSAGLFGLMQAIDAYDLERGFKFETYCTQRIRGAIYDELRAMDWVPRLVRSRSTKVDRARKSIEMETGLKATESQIIKELEVDKDEFEKIERDSRPVMMTSLNRKAYDSDSSKEVQEIDVIKDQRQENPVIELQKKDLQLLLTKGLTRAERLIVVLYYYEEMTMKEIGLTLDLSESRVSQMHSSILARLKSQMQYRSKEF
ncbi:MAG: FliA/WhiG family RNA polymerase sigma factor [Phycisphaerales bacterium]|nr:FliA/WhiG family RNA polymerase sigma factor [Phycisphaerales bacterium]